MPASLTIESAGTRNKVFIQSPKVIVGRGVESDIKIKDLKVSKAHFAIIRTQSGYALKDLTEGNETSVNGKAVKQVLLKDGDVITLGDTTIQFAADGQTGAMPAAGVKKSTVAVRKPTTAMQKPPTGTLPKAPTQRVATGKTTAAKPITGRVPTSKPPTSRVKPATGRAAVERRPRRPIPKRRSPLAGIVLVVVFIGVIVGVGAFLTGGGGGDDVKKLVRACEAQIKESFAAQERGELDVAKREAEEAIQKADKAGDDGESAKAQAKARLDEVLKVIGQVDASQKEYDALKKMYDDGKVDDYRDFETKLNTVRERYANMQKLCKWYENSDGLLRKVKDDIARTSKQRITWGEVKSKHVEPLATEGKFTEAVAKANEWMAKLGETDQESARRYLENLTTSVANTHLSDVDLRKVKSFQRGNELDKAKEYLRERLPHYEAAPDAKKACEAALKKLDAGTWP